MIGKTNGQGSLIQLVSLEELVPQNHFLRYLDRALNLSFISKFLSPAYHPTHGREGIVPALAMRMILVGYLYDLSEVRLCEEVGLHAAYRWFCRLDFHDPVPDRTTLVKFRKRCREHGLWEELFRRIVAQCGDVGLLSGRHLMADSTQVQANASIKSLRETQKDLTEAADRLCAEETPEAKSKKDHDPQHTDFHGKRFSNKTHRSATDPDAQFYRKSKGKEAKLSYKAHYLADTKSRVIVAASATRVSGDDARDGAQALSLLKQASEAQGINPNTLCADAMYGNAETIASLYNIGIEAHIPLLSKIPPEIPTWKRRTFNIDRLRKRKEKWTRAVALHHAAERATTRGYNISRKLRHRIEHLFGEAKQSHGLSRARYRGLAKMNEQVALTAIAQNLKRLVKYLNKPRRALPGKGVVRAKHLVNNFHSYFLKSISAAKVVFRHFANLHCNPINQAALQKG